MKLLTLFRHGKSDWGPQYQSDFERPLKERGRRDSSRMGKYLARLALIPDLIVCSPAERARQTAGLFAAGVGYRQAVRWDERIYAASSGELMSLLRGLPDEAAHVVLIGHNPGFEDLTVRLIGADAFGMATGVRLPTAALAHLVLDISLWSEAQADSGQLQWLVTPKLLKKLVRS